MEIHANFTNSIRILWYFRLSCEHNVESYDRICCWIRKNFTSILALSPVSVFKPCGAKAFSLPIHSSSWYLSPAAVLMLFCNMVTLRLSFIIWILWKCFPSLLLPGLFFFVVAKFGVAFWKIFPCRSNT